jgi:hypothetical protein
VEPPVADEAAVAEESPSHPESGIRRPTLAASLELTAPWPPTVDPVSSVSSEPSEEPAPVSFFALDDDDEIPPSEEFAVALREGDAGLEASFLPMVVASMRSTDEAVHEALEPLMQAASDAFVSAAGEKEAAAVAASERESLYLPSEAPFVPQLEAFVVAPYQPRQSDVQQLIAGFGDSGDSSLSDVTRELQRFAGIGGTPDPGAVAISPRSRKAGIPRR